MSKKGVLLVNLGTPENPSTKAVAKYLREFLMDGSVIDIGPVSRWLLVNCIIVPFRASRSAEAYQKIWTKEGSPLAVYSQQLLEKLSVESQGLYEPLLAMRYGTPSIEKGLKSFFDRGIRDVLIFPLYPQYSMAATRSVFEKVDEVVRKNDWKDFFVFEKITSFYNDDGFTGAFADQVRKNIKGDEDYFLFSFHGVPERQIGKESECFLKGTACADSNAKSECKSITKEGTKNCYRAQCFETARLIAKSLKLDESKYSVSFQSRLGRTPWIKPYTDIVLNELAEKGIIKLSIICPTFVADCLETVEEIQIRAKAQFETRANGRLELIPSLNAEKSWVSAVHSIIARYL